MTTATKIQLDTKWAATKVQHEAAFAFANFNLAAMQILAKHGGQPAMEEFQTLVRNGKLEHLKSLNVKTPLELAKATAEFEANVFGSKLEVTGTDNEATITYQSCGMWDAMQKTGKITKEMEEKMGSGWESCVQATAKSFGFTAVVKMEEPMCAITYKK